MNLVLVCYFIIEIISMNQIFIFLEAVTEYQRDSQYFQENVLL